MRPLCLSWLLFACACSTSNPLFELMTGGAADSTGAGASTDAPPTSTTSASTGAERTTGGIGEATGQPTGPDTEIGDATSDTTSDQASDVTTDPATSTESTMGSSGGTEWVCDPMINGFAQNIPRDLLTNEVWKGCDKMQQPFQTIIGHGVMTAQGALHFAPGVCAQQEDNFKVELGTGYPAPERAFCGRLRIVWAADDPGCKIAAFTLEEFDADNQSLGDLYALYHSPAVLPPGLPYAPKLAPEGSCGCPNVLEKCCAEEPGQHSLMVLDEQIAPGDTAMIGGLLFTNWNANIWPECIEDPTTPPRIDWFGARVD